MLEVVTPAASHSLTTKEAFKAEMGISGSGQDTAIDEWIAQASSMICGFCRRATFMRETVRQTEVLEASLSQILLDREYAVVITSVVEGGVTLDPSLYEVFGRVLYRLSSSGDRDVWSCGDRVVILYAAGYSSISVLPAALQRACLDVTKEVYFAKGENGRLKSEKVLDIIEQSWAVSSSSSGSSPISADVQGKLLPFVDEVIV